VNVRNERCFTALTRTGAFHTRIFAKHHPKNATVLPPNLDELPGLFKNTGFGPANKATSNSRLPRHVLDLAIGSRVACTQNLATELGLYQGALGTIIGFGYQGDGPPHKSLPSQVEYLTSSEANKREIPVVFVQMDVLGDSAREDRMKLSCMPNMDRVVPFVALPSKQALQHKYLRY
jgi:hypothetical protein